MLARGWRLRYSGLMLRIFIVFSFACFSLSSILRAGERMVLVQWRTVYGTVETVAVPESEVPAGVQRTYVPGPPTAPPPTPSISHPAPVSNQAMVNFFRRAKSRNASAPRTPEVEIVPPPFVPQNPVVDPFPDEVEFLPPAAPPKLSTVTPPPPIVVVPPRSLFLEWIVCQNPRWLRGLRRL